MPHAHANRVGDTSFKDPTDPQWLNDAGYKQWLAFMDKYHPNGDKTDNQTVYGYSIGDTTAADSRRSAATT